MQSANPPIVPGGFCKVLARAGRGQGVLCGVGAAAGRTAVSGLGPTRRTPVMTRRMHVVAVSMPVMTCGALVMTMRAPVMTSSAPVMTLSALVMTGRALVIARRALVITGRVPGAGACFRAGMRGFLGLFEKCRARFTSGRRRPMKFPSAGRL